MSRRLLICILIIATIGVAVACEAVEYANMPDMDKIKNKELRDAYKTTEVTIRKMSQYYVDAMRIVPAAGQLQLLYKEAQQRLSDTYKECVLAVCNVPIDSDKEAMEAQRVFDQMEQDYQNAVDAVETQYRISAKKM